MRNSVASAAEAAEAHATLTRKTSRDSTRMTLETEPLYLRLQGSRTTGRAVCGKAVDRACKTCGQAAGENFFPRGSGPETRAGGAGRRSSRSASLDRSCGRAHDRPLSHLTIR